MPRTNRPTTIVSRLLLLPSLALLGGCDEVAWGGLHVGLKKPGAPSEGGEAQSSDPGGVVPLPAVPALYVVRPEGGFASISAVGEITADVLRALPAPPGEKPSGSAERGGPPHSRPIAPGRRFSILRGGAKVGTFVAGTTIVVDSSLCRPSLKVAGKASPALSGFGASTLLALPEEDAAHLPTAEDVPPRVTGRARATSTELASAILHRLGARFPPEPFFEARQDIRAMRLTEGSRPAIAATFMRRDSLRVGPAPPSAYALFFIGEFEEAESEYRTTFEWYRPVGRDGKGAPRVVDHADWDGDGEEEVLLQLFGSERTWFAGVERIDGRWRRVYEDACEATAG